MQYLIPRAMELHRLKEMKKDYDKDLFCKLYKETEGLRNNLTYQIDSRRYGVTPDIIKSWFDDKFIFVFNKYYGDIGHDQLKAYLINALRTFKFRMLRKAYSKNNIYLNEVYLEGEQELINIIPQKDEVSEYDIFLELALKYLKKNLTDDAFLILEIQLNPPPFILSKVNNPKTKIPAKLIAEYLELEPSKESTGYISDLRNEINYWTIQAKEYFTN